jgi:Asp-tRNA(Asn)/Glu-tRNA(Gln) amidotransferase A subunit family amidase
MLVNRALEEIGACEPVRRARVSISDSQHGRFVERSTHNLKTERKSVSAKAATSRRRRQAGEIAHSRTGQRRLLSWIRTLPAQQITAAMQPFDALITPTTPHAIRRERYARVQNRIDGLGSHEQMIP